MRNLQHISYEDKDIVRFSNLHQCTFQYQDVNNLYGWTKLQKLAVNNFKWIEDTSHFNEDFIKNYNEEKD